MAAITATIAVLCGTATASGLVDSPIAGDSLTYLDGTWQLSSGAAVGGTCTFTEGTDWKPANGKVSGYSVAAATKDECCQACLDRDDCVVAVFLEDGTGCWIKSESDAAGGSYPHSGRLSCKKVPGPPGPPLYAIQGKVPGDLITDLQNAGLIDDPLYELNWLNSSLWDVHDWVYTTSVSVSAEEHGRLSSSVSSLLLVFDGVKMGAKASINGKVIGSMADEYRRYEFVVPASMLQVGDNKLEVIFTKEVDCNGRWMACTGGWDWAPYSNTQEQGINTFSKGIWKSVYTVEVSSAAITAVVPQIFYSGEYPTSPLQDGSHGGFAVDVRVHLWATAATSGTVAISGDWGETAKQTVQVPAGDSDVTLKMTASANQIKLWWPAGHGAQPLYNITTSFTPSTPTAAVMASPETIKRVGFRMFALVTGNDSDPAYVKANGNTDGTDVLGMLWRINGAVIWCKGANMIPMEELEGRMSADAHTQLVRNAVAGGLNTLRVWGGGMFLPEAWYDACDEMGIMIYHDMQYAQGGHSPANTTDQTAELQHQIRRLANHPSIVMWDGCNECHVVIGTPTGIYATFVMTVVAQEDKSRVVWPSCPASGWTSGVNRLTSIPNGNTLTTPKEGPRFETHGPYQHGTGFPAVNGASNLELFPSNIPIQVDNTATGPGLPNVFASEFGSSVYSSFESMSPTLDPKHWSIHGGAPPDTCQGGFQSHCKGNNTMAQRNYPCDNIIDVYFGTSNFDEVGETTFKKQLWQCMVGQALLIKQNIETRRSKNEFGCIVWQFNEIWPTGGWGSIEYGTVGYTSGQVLGGRWKPLQHWYKQSIYADVMATCGQGGSCYVKNDAIVPFSGTVEILSVNFATSVTKQLYHEKTTLAAGAGTKQMFTVPTINGTTDILLSTVTADDGTILSQHPVPMTEPKNMKLPQATVTFKVAEQQNADGSVDVTVISDNLALYVTLTTLAQGYFTENAYMLIGGVTKTVQFIPVQGFTMDQLKSLRVEHAATYM